MKVQTFLCIIFLWCASVARGANGTWINASGGSWGNTANWSGGVIASGSGSTGNFATINLPGNPVVTLDGARTISSLLFDDLNSTKHNWTLNPGPGGSLTLAGTPLINVESGTATINASIAGTVGFMKSGAGKLSLKGTNTYSGTTVVASGPLGLGNASLSAVNVLNISIDGLVESEGRLSIIVNSTSTAIGASGLGTLRLVSSNSSPAAPDLDFGPNHSANSFWGARLGTPLDLGTTQRFIFGRTGHNGVGPYGVTGADCQFGGPISGSGGLTLIAQNNWTGTGPMETAFALNAANTFTGPVEIRRGSVYLGHPSALVRTNNLKFNPAAGHNARLFLYGNNATVSDLASTGSGAALIANGNLKTGATLTLGGVTLNVQQNIDGNFGGTIGDVFAEYTGSGSGTTGPLNLTKNGPARLTLSGACSHTGTTAVNAGTLQVDGSIDASAISVANGATLAGSGVINSPLTLAAGATLSAGSAGIGTLTINNALTLGNATVRMEVSKNGSNLSSDRIAGVSSLTYGGLLVVTNVGPGTLAAGDNFTLFSANSYANSLANMVLPTLSSGLVWHTTNLNVNGSVTVVGTASPPVIVSQPQSLAVSPGNPATFSAVAAGVGSLSYQWRKGATNIPGATGTSYAIAAASTNDSAGYSVVVTNLYGSVTSSVAVLTVGPTLTNGLLVYLNFDNNFNAQGGTTNHGAIYTGGATLGPRYAPGVVGQAASFANSPVAGQPDDWALTLGNLERFYSNSFTVSLWERTPASADSALMGNKDWNSGANVGWVISSLDPKNLNYNAVGGTRRDIDMNPPFSDNQWHLITISFNRAANQVISYVDGAPVSTTDISPSGNASLNAGFNTLIGSSGNGNYSAIGAIDELALWGRVLSPAEISGIYGAGLAGKPLTAAIAGSAPVISEQPMDVNVSIGSSTILSVTASGQGTLTYQWRFNGTNIVGATNSTLVISNVTAANQGIYTVVVSSGTGAVLSSSAVLSVYQLGVTGQWDFNDGTLRPTVGVELEFLGDTADATTFTGATINGQSAGVMAFAANSQSQGFYMRHGAKPNGGGKFVNQYTLVMDVMFPSGGSPLQALFQTDPFNRAGNDADFYLGNNASAPDPYGLGAAGQFNGALQPGVWYRIAFAVDLSAPAGQQLAKYVNGVQVATQSLPGGVDGRYALGPTAVLFSSGLAGPGFTRPGYVNSIQFINGWLPPSAIAMLSGPTAKGLPAGNAALAIVGISSNGSTVDLSWTGPDGEFQLERATNMNNQSWQLLTTITNRSFSIPITVPTAFYRIRQYQPDIVVGQLPFGEQSLPSKQILRAAGAQLQFAGRPVDLALSPDGRTAFIKNMNNLLVVDVASWNILQTLNYPGNGASMHGITVNSAGTHVYVSGSGNELYDYQIGTNQTVAFSRTIACGSDPCGIALSADGTKAYVCLSVANKLAVVNLATGTVTQQINVGIAPWDVALSPDGTKAYVSDWGGRFPTQGDLTAPSAGTQVVIDSRGVASSGVLSFVDLNSGLQTSQLTAGLHPSDLELSPDGNTLYIANANSDTITVVDTVSKTTRETILVRPDPTFPYGSAADGLALSKDGKHLFVASAGNNSVAVIELPNAQHTNSVVVGFVPTDWYPGAVVADSNSLYVVNVKGLGSRQGQPATTSWQIGAFLGTANKIGIPTAESLSKHTAQAFEDGRVPHVKATQKASRPGQQPVPVPARVGEPSVFQHVLYILKENKTYDQMFGDIPQGNGEPSLCIYPQFVSPNHHALAQQYVLLDNFYCNGVNSSDGHSWSTEGNVTDHLEKSFGGFSRSYTFGDDPLTYSSSGFIWNNVLEHGLTFRNYGEMDYASTSPPASWLQIYTDYTNGTGAIRYVQNIGIASLRPYSSTNVPGWNVGIPDVVRAAGFIKELNAAQSNGVWATFHFLYLPNDHTGGPPTPRAQVADNDLSLGMVVEAVTKSIFASNTVIFVVEDDPQSGYDHVDAHRSICLVISPYTKRGQVVSTFYNQAGVLHTMQRIMGLPAMNQQDAMAPLMFDCFTNVPNFTPYTALPNNINLAEGVSASLTPKQQQWARKIQKMDFSRPDRIDDDLFNRYIWFSIKGDAPYPSKFVGGHGRGLKKLGLVLDKNAKDDDDD